MMAAILMWLNCLLMITSDRTRLCQVPVKNRLMYISSRVVWPVLNPPLIPEVFHEFQDFLCAMKWGGLAISYVRGRSFLGVTLYLPDWTFSKHGETLKHLIFAVFRMDSWKLIEGLNISCYYWHYLFNLPDLLV